MEKHSTENKNAPRMSYRQSDNWINIDVPSCVLHAAVPRSSYSNFVAGQLWSVCPFPCNTQGIVSVPVIAPPLSPGAPVLELSFPMHSSGMSSVEHSFAHLPGLLHRSQGHFSHSPSSSSASFYSPVDVALQSLEPGSLSELPSITQGGINWAVDPVKVY